MPNKCLTLFLIFLLITLARQTRPVPIKNLENMIKHDNSTESSHISKRSPNSAKLQINKNFNHLSNMSGSSRKIQLYVKNHYIQLLPNSDGNRGIVNGTISDLSNYSILQRTSVDVGQVKFQGIASCLFLCLDSCGYVYATEHFNDDCVFNEIMEQHHYNIYFSTFHSDEHQKVYLALDRFGEPRKTILPYDRPLGKLASYVKALTVSVPHSKYEELISSIYGSQHIRHNIRRICSNKISSKSTSITSDKCNKKQTSTKFKREKEEKNESEKTTTKSLIKPTKGKVNKKKVNKLNKKN